MKKILGGLISSFLLSCLFFDVSADISTDFGVIFQNPSYIIELDELENKQLTESGSIYHCDEEREQCKVNLKILEPDLTNLSSRLECQIDFGFESDQSLRCNPNTVIFPEGKHEINISVWEKKDPENITQISYVFLNRYEEIEEKPQSPHSVSPNGREEEIKEKEKAVYSGEFQPKFSYPISDEVELVSSNITQDPHSVSPKGREEDHLLEEKDEIDEEVVYEEKIIEEAIHFEYIFQQPSYITGTGGVYHCDPDREECKINLKFIDSETKKDISSKFECKIDFGFESDQDKRCNPSTVIIPSGEYEIIFKIYEKEKLNNFSIQKIRINNSSHSISPNGREEVGILQEEKNNDIPEEEEDKEIEESEKTIEIIEEIYLYVKGIVQSKNSKNRTISRSAIICVNVSRCNVNLSSEIETNGTKSHVKYFWDFGNGEYSTKANPSGVWYSPGEYKILLTVSDDHGNKKNHIFSVSVSDKISGLKESVDTSEDIIQLGDPQLGKLDGLLEEEIDIETPKKIRFSQSITKQKKSLKIYGKTLPNTTIYIFFGDKKYEVTSNEKGNYSLKLSYLQPGEYSITSHVLTENGEIYDVPRIKTVELSQEYILDMNTRNNTIYQKKVVKKTKQIKQEDSEKINNKKELSIISKAHAGGGEDTYSSAINFRLLNILLAIMSMLMTYLVLRKWRII